ncbi:MAG TPA: tautomerase family protein [Syntrophorhabdaceae bacterium]|nr:tautomerase family protein [Syntrophorhabdaceae bacterium]
MPICDIVISESNFPRNKRQIIIERLTKILLEAEGFEDNPISRSICFINLHSSNSMYIGGNLSKEGKIIVTIYVFAEAYSDETRARLFRKVTNLFVEEDDYTAGQKGQNIWCVILHVEKNNFAVGGDGVSLAQVSNLVKSHKI